MPVGRCAVGGTFEILHRGHRTLLARAFQECDEVLIGLTTDEFANTSRKRRVRPYAQREREIRAFIDDVFEGRRYTVVPISDELGPAATQADIDSLVVSVDSYRNGKRVNEARAGNGLPPLRIVRIPHVLADDGTRISSTKVLSGVCDPDGHRIDDLD
jgi:cytidyltransferase-like protein